jgi:hypothetical protein
MILASSKLFRNPDLLVNTVDNETVMMSVEKGNYYGFNATGNIIWNFLETEKTMDELLHFLQEKFNLIQENIDNEVYPFVEKLLEEKILITK